MLSKKSQFEFYMENTNPKFDIALLALKGKRYAEAEEIYLKIATEENSAEAWVGLGFCKLNQLAEGRNMDEVSFCLKKAIKIEPNLQHQIESQFIGHCVVLLSAYSLVFDAAIKKDRALKKKAAIGAIVSAVSVYSGLNSKSAFGTIASIAGASAGIGIAIDSLGKIQSVSEFKTYLISVCNSIHNEVKAFVSPSHDKIIEYDNFIKQYINCIQFKAKLNVPIENDDLMRMSYLSNNITMISFKDFKENEAKKKELSALRSKYEIDALEGGKLTVQFKKTPLH